MRIFFAVLLILSQLACSKSLIRLNDDELKNLLAKITTHNSQVEQLKALVDIQGKGFMGLIFHEQADIIVQKPHNLLLSMRSFFESPASQIASNGRFITLFDISSGQVRYEKLALDSTSFVDLFDYQIHPELLINLLLNHVPLDQARNLSAARKLSTLELSANLANNLGLRVIYDEATNHILQTRIFDQNSRHSIEVRYYDFADQSGILFPSLYVVRASSAKRVLNFEMRIKQAQINGPPVSADVFYLQ